MLKNYLKIALRNILKYKGYSLINILGLAIGMACCMVILLYVRHELSFDRFHSKAERIFRLNKIATSQDGVAEHHAISSGAMGPALTSNYAEVEQSLRVLPWFDEVLMTAGEKTLKVSNVVFADSNFSMCSIFTCCRAIPILPLPRRYRSYCRNRLLHAFW